MKNRLTTPFIIGFILMVMGLSACKPAQRPIEQDALVAHIDSTVKPGDDFFSLPMVNGLKRIRYQLQNKVTAYFN